MIVSVVQMNSTIGDFERNAARIAELAAKAASAWPPATGSQPAAGSAPPDLIVFPELSVCGYPPMDLLDQESFADASMAALRSLQRSLASGPAADIPVAVGHVDRNISGSGKALVNAVSVIRRGRIEFSQHKTLLPTYDVFDEARYFEPARRRALYDTGRGRVGFAICEDIWWEAPPSPGFRYTIDPVRELLDEGADIIVAPSASPFVAGKLQTRLSLARGAARQGGIPVVYCNAVGANDSLVFDGRSFAVDPAGAILGICGWDEGILAVDTGSHDALRDPEMSAGAARAAGAAGAAGAASREEEIRRALVTGIRDYMAKSGFRTAVLGMSGGIDSALVAVLAAEAVGAANVTCVTMPSRFSSEGSVNDSVELCRRAGMRLERLPIETPFKAYLDLLAVPFAGRPFDLAEENLQARIRGALLMAWSNKFGSLLLTTGNKSELATGYCTLYGDMCGALAPIGDLYKTEVYALCEHINRAAVAEGRPEPIPRPIIDKAPSAELRENQKDQDSLPPYEVLDAILRRHIEGNMAARRIAAEGFDPALVERILGMTIRAEYKRRQAAPAIKVSSRAFGVGRRIPLARAAHELRS